MSSSGLFPNTTAWHQRSRGRSTTRKPTSSAMATSLANFLPETWMGGSASSNLPPRFQTVMNLAQQAALIWHFMKHRKDEGEVSLGIDPKPILLTLMQLDSGNHARLLCSPPQHVEHLLLEIDGDHLPVVADHPRHRNREPAHTATHVHHGHAGLDVWPNDLLRIVNQRRNGGSMVNGTAHQGQT